VVPDVPTGLRATCRESAVSVIEAVTVVRYRVKRSFAPKGWRGRGLRATKALAYRDAAWATLRANCMCVHNDEIGGENKLCRYHDKAFRARQWTADGPEEPGWFGFAPPEIWGLPRSDDDGYWDYGRALAFRLARFYRHLDSRAGGEVGTT
jgi:hypothetical protein